MLARLRDDQVLRLRMRLKVTLLIAILWASPAPAQELVTPALLARIDSLVAARREWLGVPGFLLTIVHPLRELHHRGFGFADGAYVPITPDTPFLVGSISKPLTAVLVMQLAAERRLNLDDRVRDLLPEFRLADTMQSRTTLFVTASHRRGSPISGLRGRETPVPVRSRRRTRSGPLGRPIGTAFTSYLILFAVQRRTG